MSSDTILTCRGLRKTFSVYKRPIDRLLEFVSRRRLHVPFDALKGIDFEIKRGETVGLLGINGSGKSTLLQIVAGTMSPSEGRIEIEGRVAALLQLGAGFIGEVTARENAILAARLYGMTEREAAERLPWIASFAEVESHLDTPVKFFSSGMYARLAFAVAVAVRPDVVLIDEALSVGDAGFQAKAEAYLANELAASAKIIVSHDLAAIERHCSRALVLDRGTLAFDGPVEEAIAIVRGTGNLPDSPLSPRIRGIGDLSIRSVDLDPGSGSVIKSGATVRIQAQVLSSRSSETPCLLGHFWTDQNGREALGGNNDSASRPLSVPPGESTIALEFSWPDVASGRYKLNMFLASRDGADLAVQCRSEDLAYLSCACDWDHAWKVGVHTRTDFSSTPSTASSRTEKKALSA